MIIYFTRIQQQRTEVDVRGGSDEVVEGRNKKQVCCSSFSPCEHLTRCLFRFKEKTHQCELYHYSLMSFFWPPDDTVRPAGVWGLPHIAFLSSSDR